MTEANPNQAAQRTWPVAVVLLAAAGCFALTMGARQSMGLFLSPLNSATGLGLGSISLAFAFGQLWWGLTQPFAGAMADRVGAGRVLLVGVLRVAVGTAITPYMTSSAGAAGRCKRGLTALCLAPSAAFGRGRQAQPARAQNVYFTDALMVRPFTARAAWPSPSTSV